MFPLTNFRYNHQPMNYKLTQDRIRGTCRELLAQHGTVSGRRLRRELRERFGAVGKTARIFRIWREETTGPATSPTQAGAGATPQQAELSESLALAAAEARTNRERAELAEFRERAHQDHWALEVDRLREQLRAQSRDAAENRFLKEQLVRLTADLARARDTRGGA